MYISFSYNRNGGDLQDIIEQYLIDFYYEFYEDKIGCSFEK